MQWIGLIGNRSRCRLPDGVSGSATFFAVPIAIANGATDKLRRSLKGDSAVGTSSSSGRNNTTPKSVEIVCRFLRDPFRSSKIVPTRAQTSREWTR